MNGDAFAKILKLTVWGLLAMLTVSSMLLQARLIADLDYDGENSGCESEQLHALRGMGRGEPVYPDFANPPHLFRGYMPLFYLVAGTVVRLLSAGDMQAFVIGRAYTYVFWVAVALVIFGLARQAGCGWQSAAIGALLWMSADLATQWANSYRPDSVALFLSLTALWVYERRDNRRYPLSTVVLLALATLHKQSAIAPMLAIGFEEFRRNGWRRAMLLFSGWGALVISGIAVAEVLTSGAFAKAIVGSLWGLTHMGRPWLMLQIGAISGAAAISGGLFACVVVKGNPCVGLLKRYFVLAWLMAISSSFKYGSYFNYYLEPYAVGCILTGVLVADWSVRSPSRSAAWGRLAWMGLVLAFSFDTLQVRSGAAGELLRQISTHGTLRRHQQEQWTAVIACVDAGRGPVLVEDPYLALRLSTHPFMIDVAQFATMQRAGTFDDAEIVRRIAQGEFVAIVARVRLETPVAWRFPGRWVEPMRKSYALDRVCAMSDGATYYVYRPRKSTEQGKDGANKRTGDDWEP
jgi:hypothetical protein